MKMKSTRFFVPLMMTIMIAAPTTTTPKPTTTTPNPTTTTPKPTTTTPKPTTTTKWTTARPTPPWTTGRPGGNLNGLMATLSSRGGAISFYPPNYSPDPSYTTRRPYYTSTAPWTTPPLSRGLTVCLRYLTDSGLSLAVSSKGTNMMTLRESSYWYELGDRWGSTLRMNPSIKILPDVAPDIWTRVCVTMDFMKMVAQVFRDSNMSIRKRLVDWYTWQVEPVIQFSGFTGQVTDIQMWDYPLNYREVTDYINGGTYRLYRGSILTWSYISYSNGGNMLLEEVYEIQAKVPIRGRGRRLRGGKKSNGQGVSMRERKRQQP